MLKLNKNTEFVVNKQKFARHLATNLFSDKRGLNFHLLLKLLQPP